jgi:hypothetical protein
MEMEIGGIGNITMVKDKAGAFQGVDTADKRQF